MEKVHIRSVTAGDAAALKAIGRTTFSETFSASNTKENMMRYLSEAFSDERVGSELSDQDSEFYFAELNGEVIGYLKLNFGPSQTELHAADGMEIERIYVLKEYHGKQVGQLLYEKAIEVALQRKAGYVWLGVWERNERAIKFYRKNGFVEFGNHTFRLGDEAQTDVMMKKDLTGEAREGAGGRLPLRG